MQHAQLVETPRLDPRTTLHVGVLHMDLRGLAEPGELLMGGLRGDDAGITRLHPQPHRVTALEQGGIS